MSFQFHGKYCGPGWTAGKRMDAEDASESDFDEPAVDELDEICKAHDYAIFSARNYEPEKKAMYNKVADEAFVKTIKESNIPGIKDNVAAFAVWALGPSPKIRGSFQTPPSKKTGEPSATVEKDKQMKPRKARTFDEMEEDNAIVQHLLDQQQEAGSPEMKRTRMNSLSNLQTSTQMETEAVASTAMVDRTEGAGATGLGTSRKETPVLPLYNTLPFRDVTQTRFKNQYFFSVNDLSWTSGTVAPAVGANTNRYLKIRMNDYRNAWEGPCIAQTANSNVVSGISTNAMTGRYRIDPAAYEWKNPSSLVPFPETNLTPWYYLPQMHRYYTNLYNAMSVVKVHWKLHIDFPNPEFPEQEITGTTTPTYTINNSAHNHSVPSNYTIPQASTTANFTTPLEGRDNTITQYNGNAYTGVPYATRQLQNAYTIVEASSTSTVPETNAVTTDLRPDYSPRPYGARIAVNYHTEGAQADESNMPVPCHIMDMERWPGITERKTIYNADRGGNGSSHHVIEGTWTPNWQNHNPLNESDIKTWLNTYAPDYTYKEFLVIQFFRTWDTPKFAKEKIGLNCWLELDYDVQFRGLKQAALWPLQNAEFTYAANQDYIELQMPNSSYYTSNDTETGTVPRNNN